MRCLVLLASAAVLFIPAASATYSAFDGGPRDYSAFAGQLEARGHRVASTVSGPAGLALASNPASTLLIEVRSEGFGDAERAALARFLASGGSMLLASQGAATDPLIRAEGVRFLGDRIVSEDNTGGAGPRIHASLAQRGFVLQTVAPYALRLLPEFRGEVVANSTLRSYADFGNATIGLENEAASFPVMVLVARPAGGMLAVSGEPDFFANQLFNNASADNRAFSLALVERLLPGPGTIVFDESLRLGSPVHRASAAAATLGLWMAAHAVALALALAAVPCGLWGFHRMMWRPGHAVDASRTIAIRRRYAPPPTHEGDEP